MHAGGNCLTAMIATISAEEINIHETISTCRFSQRVACISKEQGRLSIICYYSICSKSETGFYSKLVSIQANTYTESYSYHLIVHLLYFACLYRHNEELVQLDTVRLHIQSVPSTASLNS